MRALHIFASIAVAVVLIVVGARLASIYGLPFLHSWALMHGSVFILFPVYLVLAYGAFRPAFRAHGRVSGNTAVPAEVRAQELTLLSLILSALGLCLPFVSAAGIWAALAARKRCKEAALSPVTAYVSLATAGGVTGAWLVLIFVLLVVP